jgi:murein DD-endopeptidase MepM/ murein hydrolase activator NlpD
MRSTLFALCLVVLTTLGVAPENQYAEENCLFAEKVDYPFDREAFQLTQAFGVPSPRHQGRYHTGEDWFAGRDQSEGLPVRAIAAGRVTYSYPLGWGRDGGVVIIEHIFPDGSIVYSQYGHMMETDAIKFPMRLSCVEAGQVIGAIGSARPAPHLHFEIKLEGKDSPGPGYSWQNPLDLGWRNPSRFIEAFGDL